MKHITYKFTDGSEIDIADDQTATIIGNTKQFAYTLWKQATKDKTIKHLWTYLFCSICDTLHQKHGIVLEKTDHFTGIKVNNFENLMTDTKKRNEIEAMQIIGNIQTMQDKAYGKHFEYDEFNGNSIDELMQLQESLIPIYNDYVRSNKQTC